MRLRDEEREVAGVRRGSCRVGEGEVRREEQLRKARGKEGESRRRGRWEEGRRGRGRDFRTPRAMHYITRRPRAGTDESQDNPATPDGS